MITRYLNLIIVCFEQDGRRFAVKGSTDRFFQCVNNSPKEFRCKHGVPFDRDVKKCINPNAKSAPAQQPTGESESNGNSDPSSPTVEAIEETEIAPPEKSGGNTEVVGGGDEVVEEEESEVK